MSSSTKLNKSIIDTIKKQIRLKLLFRAYEICYKIKLKKLKKKIFHNYYWLTQPRVIVKSEKKC